MLLDTRSIQFINAFEQLTGVRTGDCFEAEGFLVFLVKKGEFGRAIGRRGSNISKVQKKFGRRILVFGTRVVHEAMRSSYYVYEKKLLQKCDALTTPSREIAEILRSRMGDQLEILVLPNGIDTDFFSETRGNMREELGIPEGRIIGFAGRHTEAKRVEDLIKLADYFDGTVVIAGEGPMTKKYKELARGKANVKFLGFLERGRLPEFYSMLDLLILPSVAETEGLVVIEANACRTPVIGANAMALRSTIVDGKTGYLYEPSNIEDMIEKVKMGYKNIEKLRRGARKHALGRSVKNTARRLSSIYEDIANKHRGRE